MDACASLSVYGSLDNMETGVITLQDDTSLNSPRPASLHNEGYVQDSGSVVNPGFIENAGGEYRLYTDDAGVFESDEKQILLPGYVTDMTFTGSLTIGSNITLFIGNAVLYIGEGGSLTVSRGGSVYIDVNKETAVQAALVLDNGSTLDLYGSITTNDFYGFRDNESRYTAQQMDGVEVVTYQVVSNENIVI